MMKTQEDIVPLRPSKGFPPALAPKRGGVQGQRPCRVWAEPTTLPLRP